MILKLNGITKTERRDLNLVAKIILIFVCFFNSGGWIHSHVVYFANFPNGLLSEPHVFAKLYDLFLRPCFWLDAKLNIKLEKKKDEEETLNAYTSRILANLT